ncbi:MAG TPA: TA system VapC family ribonuclease toxin [Acidimicrobiales bacterium]|nr:TA system VapC family ribonuclease toxin [Acidimicrobiales bacterium]
MKLVDANVLLYALDRDAHHHSTARRWLDSALSGEETVAFAWVALLAFVRLATRADLFPNPLTVDAAFDRVDAWLSADAAVVLQPTPEHGRVLRQLLTRVGAGGNLVNDGHLAALAVEHRATVVSYDGDFARFDGVTWEQPT